MAARITGLIEDDTGDADAREVSPSNKPGEKIEMAVTTARGGWIQDPFDLLRIAGLRIHDLSEPLQLKATHRPSPRQATMASITRLVSWGSLISIEGAPASFAG